MPHACASDAPERPVCLNIVSHRFPQLKFLMDAVEPSFILKLFLNCVSEQPKWFFVCLLVFKEVKNPLNFLPNIVIAVYRNTVPGVGKNSCHGIYILVKQDKK